MRGRRAPGLRGGRAGTRRDLLRCQPRCVLEVTVEPHVVVHSRHWAGLIWSRALLCMSDSLGDSCVVLHDVYVDEPGWPTEMPNASLMQRGIGRGMLCEALEPTSCHVAVMVAMRNGQLLNVRRAPPQLLSAARCSAATW